MAGCAVLVIGLDGNQRQGKRKNTQLVRAQMRSAKLKAASRARPVWRHYFKRNRRRSRSERNGCPAGVRRGVRLLF